MNGRPRLPPVGRGSRLSRHPRQVAALPAWRPAAGWRVRIGLLAAAWVAAAAGGAWAAVAVAPPAQRSAAGGGSVAPAAPITVAEYRRRLVDLREDLRRGDREAVRRDAANLEPRRVRWGGGVLATDRSLLEPLAAKHGGAETGRAVVRLSRLIAALPDAAPAEAERGAGGGGAAPDADAAAGPRGAAAGVAGASDAGATAGLEAAAGSDAAAGATAGPGAAAGEGAAKQTAPAAGAAPDRALLERLRREQALADLPAGGKLPDPGLKAGGLVAALIDFVRPAARSVAEAWERFWKWFERWLEGMVRGRQGQHGIFSLWSVEVLVVILAVAMLALAARALWLRRRRGEAAGAGAGQALPAATARDDDPFSRGASEWEVYARELAAAGRFREAIRAWYHAVLVVLYQSGALHFRKGRTNWEYIATVPSGTAWRPALVEITRQFEREWYGRERSTAEALDASRETARHLLATLRSAAA